MYHVITATSTPAKPIKETQVGIPMQSQKTIVPPASVAWFVPLDLMHLNEARKVGAQLLSLKAGRAAIHPPNPGASIPLHKLQVKFGQPYSYPKCFGKVRQSVMG